MNCLDYRRMLLAGEGETEAMKAHRLQCAPCAQLLEENATFESDLRHALEVPVASGFENRLARTGLVRRRRFLAAAGIAALASGTGLFVWLARQDPLALACIDFVMKEEAKSIMMGAMPHADAARALAGSLPIERLQAIGQVRHISPCPFNGATAYHVVLAVPQGKVTLLVMPASAARNTRRADHDGLYASVVPAGKGSVGIVGTDASVVESVAGALRS